MREAAGENQGERDPHRGPDRRLPRPHLMHLSVEHAEVEREHREDEGNEANPEPDVRGDHEGLWISGARVESQLVATSATVGFGSLFKISPPRECGMSGRLRVGFVYATIAIGFISFSSAMSS